MTVRINGEIDGEISGEGKRVDDAERRAVIDEWSIDDGLGIQSAA
jgi:hypothetical protein